MSEHHERELRIRRVLDVDAMEETPGAIDTFRQLIEFYVSNDLLNIKFHGLPEHETVDMILDLLRTKLLVFVCYTDPMDPSAWRLEPGPELAHNTLPLPLDISLN